ncbi:AAA family ATPase [Chromohalobacter israelensis]|uniref:AAA family ATPase n=1 Tax=Chromohalobacter israelensis TaxID=141390 RepID=UPI00265BBACA|nr:AAA family ATPase [Chromohalobacter salexigens]MDO0944576.1 AAA family ATPase [Chromohalobacter salexigens]
MKILALRLANLASIPGPLELDFTAAPLRDAGLFAITGPTGAGKSTLLDALCLALYGGTPRLRQAPGREAPLPDVEGETLNTADPRTLLRRGTASGHAEVDFLGRDGRRYRARWAVRRAREKADGKLQKIEQSLTDLDSDRLLTTQKREFDRLLPERLGLSFEQFTRAVLLAQSEFAAFLKADDNERSDLLERLTGTAEYSAISIAAYRRASDAKRAVDALETRLADDLPADSEARAELERHAQQTQAELDAVQRQARHLEAQAQWHATDAKLRDARDHGQREHRDAEAHWQTLAPQRADREWRRLIAPQRHRLTRQAELPHEIARLEKTHAATREDLARAETAQHGATRARDEAEQALAQTDAARQHAEPTLRQAREQAQQLATQEQQLAELEQRHAERHRQSEALAARHRQARETQQRQRQQRDDWQATLRQSMGDHARVADARQAAQQAHDQAAQRHLALGELHSRWQDVQRADDAHRTLTERLEADTQRRETLLTQGQAARQRRDDCDRHYRTVREMVERNRAVRSESVTRLREHLQDGQPCPVCGGLDHPWRHAPPASPESAQLAAQQAEEERQLTQAQQALDDAQQQRDELLGHYRALETSLTQQRQDLADADKRRQAAHRALDAHALGAELAAIEPPARDDWLVRQRQDADATRQQHAHLLHTLSQAERELEPLDEALRQSELTLAQLDAQRTGLDQELAQLTERLPPLREARDACAAQLAGLLGEHASPDAWQQSLDAARDSARQARDAALTRLHDAQQHRQTLAQQAQHESERLDALRDEKSILDRDLAEWRAMHPDLSDALLERLLAQTEDEIQRQERQLEETERTRQRTEATLAERRQALIAHRRDQELVAKDADETALLGDAAEEEIARRRLALDHAREELAPRHDAAQAARDHAAHALHDDDRRRERQQAGQAELEAARHEYRRWGRISELIGSADGKVFRRIAQAYNLEQLLEHANAHLHGLSRRYRLMRGGSELGLLVIDHDMGDERRSVHSLSGGETFLVSLALALGLASMASGELTIESLFIDEGFGSLDPQSLALAMEALDGLQALGRRVGVISHVQEMHERIPVQIQVEPLGNGTSRARLVSG